MSRPQINNLFRTFGLNIDARQLSIKVKNYPLSEQNLHQLMNSLKFSSKLALLKIEILRSIGRQTIQRFIADCFPSSIRQSTVSGSLTKLRIVINFNTLAKTTLETSQAPRACLAFQHGHQPFFGQFYQCLTCHQGDFRQKYYLALCSFCVTNCHRDHVILQLGQQFSVCRCYTTRECSHMASLEEQCCSPLYPGSLLFAYQ